jgi:predicted NBD/HSP70 family sugar kinase
MPDDVASMPIDDAAPPGCGPLGMHGAGQGGAPPRPMRAQVFDRIRAMGRISRIDLAKHLAVSPASVTAAVADLAAQGLVAEYPLSRAGQDAGRGRPPVALGVRPEAGAVAGIKLSDTVHSAVIMDFAGNRLAEATLPAAALRQDTDALVAAASALLDTARMALLPGAPVLRAVGVGLPGLVDHATGHVPWSPILADRDVALRDILERRLQLPVVLDNDANLVTLAELWFGAGRERPDFAVLTIEYGVGMGLVIDNRLYRGAQGLGTEIGHTKVQLDGALCRCGRRGCLEAYVADYALVREATTALNWGNRGVASPTVLLESLYDHAKAGNAAARAIFRRAGRYLAVALANVATLFDPSLILISGERMRYDYLYAEEVLAEMRALLMDTGRPPPRVEIRAWGDLVWAQGAAALALELATATALAPEG